MVAMLVATAAPAAAQTTLVSFGDGDDFCEDFDGDFFCDFDEFCEDFDEDFFCDFDDFDNDFFDFGDGINQYVEQEAESGDIEQSFDVSQTGDNSNQTVSTQGVANTGNAQNVIDVVDAGDFGDFDNNDNDNFVICDFDNDGDDDECEDFNDGFVICDFDGDGRDDGDDD